MRYVVLGAGRQGLACAYDLLRYTDAEVVLADRQEVPLPPFLQGFGDRLRFRPLDVLDAADLQTALQAATVVCNATPYYFNLAVTRAALTAGAHVCDLGGNTEIVLQQLALDAEARAGGCSVLPDCGLAPGLVNILAAECIRALDRVLRVRILTGGLPQEPRPPLNYQVVYSLDGVLDYYTSKAIALEEGEIVEREALSGIERLEFPGLGELEAFVTAGGISTMPYTYRGRVSSMAYKTLRYPGHAEKMRVLRELGLLSLEEISVDGASLRPRDVTKTVLAPLLGKGRDLVVVRVEAEGERAGAGKLLRYDLLDRYDDATGITAMERTTGFGLAVSGEFQAAGLVAPGACTPDQAIPADVYLAALERRGIHANHIEIDLGSGVSREPPRPARAIGSCGPAPGGAASAGT